MIPPVICPCGSSKRLFAIESEGTFSLHKVRIRKNPIIHYHCKNTEIYYILNGKGNMELDGKIFPVSPGNVIMIKPYCRHRIVPAGEMEILNFCIPAFNGNDEFIDRKKEVNSTAGNSRISKNQTNDESQK